LLWPIVEENGVTRTKKYLELSVTEAIQADCDVKATNIILQGLLPEVYALVSTHKVMKELWESIQMLMQGTSLTKQEGECKLYDEFDKFAYRNGESLRDFFLSFSLLLNDMNIYNMKLDQFQVNTKFLNTLPPEWSKFVTNVKLVRDLHTTNVDQLHAYLGQLFQKGDDPIDAINHMMSFLTTVVTSRYPPTNNQLRTLSNPRQQATINNGRVTIQPIQGRENSMTAGMSRQYTSGPSGTLGKQRVIVCYNFKGEGHMSKQCTRPKRKRDEAWFKAKVLLFQAQANGQVLHEEELEFLRDPGIVETQTHSMSSPTMLLIKLMIWMPMTLTVMNLILSRLLSCQICLIMDSVILLRNNSFSQQSAPTFDQLFEINYLKAKSQEKDLVIMKLKERIKSLCGNVQEEKIKRELEEIETINIELDHSVTKLVAKNKQLYDSIKSSRVRTKEQCDDLIKQVNIKSVEISDLNASLQEKVLVITALKETVSKLKGKVVVNEAVTLQSIDLELLKIDVAPLAPKLHNHRTTHNDYLKYTQEETATLREIVENERFLNPLNTSLDYACKYAKCIQELLIILKQTRPCINDLGTKLMVVTPTNNNKKIRFIEHIPSSGNTPVKTTSSTGVVPNTLVLSSTGVNLLSSASGSQPQGNTKKDRIQ
nr:hypothetical protein [Tanacetum cinerariifolium]